MRINKSRTLLYDLEVSPIQGWTYGTYDTNVLKIDKVPILLSVAWKWEGEKRIHYKDLTSFPLYKKDPHNDKALAGFVGSLIDEADIVVAYNVNGFDIKVTNTRLIAHGFNPPSFYRTYDPLQVARRHFKFPNNKLDTVARFFGFEGKSLSHSDLWEGCYNGDMKKWKLMRIYNKHDITMLEFVYHKLRPWGAHPNMNVFSDVECCPVCSSTNFKEHEKRATNTALYQGYKCLDCGKRFQGGKNLLSKVNLK